MNQNPFHIYTSKIKRINIPIPAFRYFHQASSNEEVDNRFFGRERSSVRLYSWLSDKDSRSGSYLVTGYRGMGKSSFVGRILYQLSARVTSYSYMIVLLAFVCIWANLMYIIVKTEGQSKNFQIPSLWIYLSLILISVFVIVVVHNRYRIQAYGRRFYVFVRCWSKIYSSHADAPFHGVRSLWQAQRTLFRRFSTDWNRLNRMLYNTDLSDKSYRRLCIHINLGQEILNEHDVLSIIAHEIYEKYYRFVNSPVANCFIWLANTLVVAVFCGIIYCYLPEPWKKCGEDFMSTPFVQEVTPLLPSIYIVLMSLVVYGLFHLLKRQFAFAQANITNKIHFLQERLDSNIELGYAMGARSHIHGTAAAMNTSVDFRKKRIYPIAQVREIEQQLIDILECIDHSFIPPSFIIVFDELDKIDSELENGKSQNSSQSPEYTGESKFPGGGTTRKRKRNVLHLLANMKMFVSSAKAKFVFISGRELYDAYLADLSDREFSISSIFNGVIYIESFCTNERRDKDIMSNAETFISYQLIPRSYIQKQVIESYVHNRLRGKSFDRLDINLKLYYRYLLEAYSDQCGESMMNGMQKPVLSDVMENEATDQQNHDIRKMIDKSIVMLYHFSVYLNHISNGSPKKMSIHFEKYVRPTARRNFFKFRKGWERNLLDQHELDVRIPDKSDFYLSFGYVDQRTIGFIHYISFPVTQIITYANQFGDKLLVSSSFIIDHIYKFHNSGFSWRNLEYTPELLEEYRIPEFRSFINSILSYLVQTHLINISCGLYQYKFRKQIAEEISLASKFSEEVSALFNFNQDESQMVKRHYFNLQEHYSEKLEKEGTDSPLTRAGIHIILADLYMADEEYTKAVFEYQTAIRILTEGCAGHSAERLSGFSDPYFVLTLMRCMLKLGQAFEKRKTYESAYATYNEIVSMLMDFQKGNAGNAISSEDIFKHFIHDVFPEGISQVQRMSFVEDIRMVYQPLLARLFVLEKMELGGITKANIDRTVAEFNYLHQYTSDKDKFLISTNFYRRMGDILFYKNGLSGFRESVVEDFYLRDYDLEHEIQLYCGQSGCHNLERPLMQSLQDLSKNKEFKAAALVEEIRNKAEKRAQSYFQRQKINKFCNSLIKNVGRDNLDALDKCKEHRCQMWQHHHHAPCYACKYYNKSFNILLCHLLGEEEKSSDSNKGRRQTRTLCVLRHIVEGNQLHSFRQNQVIQMAEVLDCMGNVMLCCATGDETRITGEFLSAFLCDVHNNNVEEKSTKEYQLLNGYESPEAKGTFFKLEKAMIYYWEASIYFRKANELKKASGSLKKILRIIQNYLKIQKDDNRRKLVIRKELEHIKQYIIKQCLISLYNHYNAINIIEIQKLKWVFYIQMYERISLSRLSMFPDVEEIMLIYYDIILHSIVENPRKKLSVEQVPLDYKQIEDENRDLRLRLVGIFRNNALSSLRIESTIYERLLSLRFKANFNQHILEQIVTYHQFSFAEAYYESDFHYTFLSFLESYTTRTDELASSLKEYRSCFPHIFQNHRVYNKDERLDLCMGLLEHLITDSIFCLTQILDTISPYTATTLFTNTFVAEIYQRLYEWNQLFDMLFLTYKAVETPQIDSGRYGLDTYAEQYSDETMNIYGNHRICPYMMNQAEDTCKYNHEGRVCPHYSVVCKHKVQPYQEMLVRIEGSELEETLRKYQQYKQNGIAHRFFTNVLDEIGKSNIHYTLGNFSLEQTLKHLRQAQEMHCEGKAYKTVINKMYYLDDELKNDTIQFDSALERLKINNGVHENLINKILNTFRKSSIHDIENFCEDNEAGLTWVNRIK